jgi:hypothetical protein
MMKLKPSWVAKVQRVAKGTTVRIPWEIKDLASEVTQSMWATLRRVVTKAPNFSSRKNPSKIFLNLQTNPYTEMLGTVIFLQHINHIPPLFTFRTQAIK